MEDIPSQPQTAVKPAKHKKPGLSWKWRTILIAVATIALAGTCYVWYAGFPSSVSTEERCKQKNGSEVSVSGGWIATRRYCVSDIKKTTDGGRSCDWTHDTCQGVCQGFWGDVEPDGLSGGSCSYGKLLFEIK